MGASEDVAQQPPEQAASVDLGGDVTLTVGNGETQVRLKVSKALLSFASKYFATLLGPMFREGADAAANKDIDLHDDDPKAMTVLCKILHMQYDLPEKSLSANELLNLAIVADKYGCIRAVKLSLESIFPRYPIVGTTFQQTGDFICAAYLFDHPVLFERFTGSAILDYAESFTELAFTETGQRVSSIIWCKFISDR